MLQSRSASGAIGSRDGYRSPRRWACAVAALAVSWSLRRWRNRRWRNCRYATDGTTPAVGMAPGRRRRWRSPRITACYPVRAEWCSPHLFPGVTLACLAFVIPPSASRVQAGSLAGRPRISYYRPPLARYSSPVPPEGRAMRLPQEGCPPAPLFWL